MPYGVTGVVFERTDQDCADLLCGTVGLDHDRIRLVGNQDDDRR